MKIEKFRELLELYFLDELDQDKKELIENKILESDEYKKEFDSYRKFYSAIENSKPKNIDENKLENLRKELFNKIELEQSQIKVKTKQKSFWNFIFFTNYKTAYAMVTTLLIGFFLGYIIFSSTTAPPIKKLAENEIDLDAIDRNEINISNIRFQNPFSDEGEIEIRFDAIKPITYKGNLNDPHMQRLLAAALVNSDNPGVRIRTVNTLALQSRHETLYDPKIKSALITALKTDENAGVRREALIALMKFNYDNEIREAYLYVLAKDDNPGLKVAAINALAELKLQGKSIDDEIKNLIENELSNGENRSIRLKAASLIQGEY
ncbi:MAG TPA: HEAT repeat domain-containing protein [Ignavibacteria bacterium]|nr:HEAT repeat domain-containing protein [Ignavibacteria bacterium]